MRIDLGVVHVATKSRDALLFLLDAGAKVHSGSQRKMFTVEPASGHYSIGVEFAMRLGNCSAESSYPHP